MSTKGADHRRIPSSLAYPLAVVLATACLLLRLALSSKLGNDPALELFLVPIILSAYVGGVGPGLVSTALVALATDYFLLPPKPSFSIQSGVHSLDWLVLIMVGTLISVLLRRPSPRSRRAVEGSSIRTLQQVPSPQGPLPDLARVPQPITQLRVWCVTVGGTLFFFLLAMLTQALFDHRWGFPLLSGVPMGHAPVMVLAIAIMLRLLMWQAQALQEARDDLEIRVQERTTELAKAQEAALSSEARLAGIINSAMDAIVTADEHQRIVLFNPAAEKMFGHRATDVIGESLDVCIPERFRVAHAQHHRAFSEAGTNWRQVGNLIPISGLRANGEEFPIEAAISKVDVAGRKVFTAILRDITERQRAEAELAERNAELDAERARWQGVVESIAEEVWVCDAQGKMSVINLQSVPPMGLEEFKDKSVAEILEEVEILYPDGQPRPPEQAPLRRSLYGEVVRGEEIMRHRPTGGLCYRRFTSAPMRDATGAITGAVAIIRDITEHKQAEQALIRTEKLAATGRLAASMAHEINNPLETVGNALYLAASDSSLSDAARAHLAVAERELERAAHLTKQTLGFYKETNSPTVLQLSNTANAVLELYRPKLSSKGIVIRREFADDDRIMAVEGEVRQILSNLLANAIDAVPQGGHISLRTSHSAALHFRHTVRFTIADTGTGIEPALREKVFEPFFTTKQSLGTGLGLWVTKELALKQQARMRLRSRVGEGTVFCVYFPGERRDGARRPRPAAALPSKVVFPVTDQI